jgi:hypothetical protein
VGAVVVAGLAMFFVALPFQVCRDWGFVCENTGSHMGYRQWWIGYRSGRWYRESHLERFLREQHPSELQNRWTSYMGTGKNILGQAVRFGHGRPRLGRMVMTPGLFDDYVDSLDDIAKLELYHLLSSGDPKAIEAVNEKVFDMALARHTPFE